MRTQSDVVTVEPPPVRTPGATDPSGDVLAIDDAVDVLDALLDEWRARGEQVLLIDVAGRHRARPGATIDLSRAHPVPGPADVDLLLHEHACVVVTDAPGPIHPALGQILTAAQLLRTWWERPRWIVLEDAQALLSDPDLPPSALRLRDGGYCLVDRAPGRVTCRLLLPRPARGGATGEPVVEGGGGHGRAADSE
jgi:hypothetical protein